MESTTAIGYVLQNEKNEFLSRLLGEIWTINPFDALIFPTEALANRTKELRSMGGFGPEYHTNTVKRMILNVED